MGLAALMVEAKMLSVSVWSRCRLKSGTTNSVAITLPPMALASVGGTYCSVPSNVSIGSSQPTSNFLAD